MTKTLPNDLLDSVHDALICAFPLEAYAERPHGERMEIAVLLVKELIWHRVMPDDANPNMELRASNFMR